MAALTGLVLSLIPGSFVISCVVTFLAYRAGVRRGAYDTGPMPGQAKEARRRVPNTGGVGVFAGVAVPIGLGLVAAWLGVGLGVETGGGGGGPLGDVGAHTAGIKARTLEAAVLLAGLAGLHGLGLVDDRRPLGPWLKLGVMLGITAVVMLGTGTRLLTALDGPAGGAWLSMAVTVVWFLAVTNALNFMDNMDGLAGGVSAVAGGCFLVAALGAGQWFVGGVLAMVVGSCLGFLVWNRPPARIFMGDGGSLVLGFLLAFLTARTTYFGAGPGGEPLAGGWYGVLMPPLVLAVPLYDMLTVTAMRLRQGRNPMVGDLQHLSHRLVKRGLKKPAAVAVILGLTATTGLGGLVIGRLPAWGAGVIAGQAALLLAVLGGLELLTSPPGARRDSLEVGRG